MKSKLYFIELGHVLEHAGFTSDVQTQQEISAYDRDVKMYAQKVMAKAESIAPMVDHVVNMFQRMISHADSGAHMKFIEADFTYEVVTSGIKYSYQSRYTNPQDDYNFNRERYRDLSSREERMVFRRYVCRRGHLWYSS